MQMRMYYNGINIKDATWHDVEAVLPKLKVDEDAWFSLDIVPCPQKGPRSLTVEANEGNYMPLMGTEVTEVDSYVRGLRNYENEPQGMVSIGGYQYTAMSVTRDFDLITRIITEFYHTGDVSRDLLP